VFVAGDEEVAPPAGGRRGLVFVVSAGGSFCRYFRHRGARRGRIDDGFAGGERGEQGLDGELVDGASVAAAGLVDQRGGVVGEQGVGAAGEGKVVAQEAGGLFEGHAGHVVADGDALVEGGELAELETAPQGELADEQASEYGGGVHVVVGERTRTGRSGGSHG
jgi:hypothetical protein